MGEKSVRETDDATSYGRSNTELPLSPPSPNLPPPPTHLDLVRC